MWRLKSELAIQSGKGEKMLLLIILIILIFGFGYGGYRAGPGWGYYGGGGLSLILAVVLLLFLLQVVLRFGGGSIRASGEPPSISTFNVRNQAPLSTCLTFNHPDRPLPRAVRYTATRWRFQSLCVCATWFLSD